MESTCQASLEAQLATLVAESSATMRALQAARELGLASWCIGAGVIRNLVWNHLHAFERKTEAEDIDLVFHDPGNLTHELEKSLKLALSEKTPGLNWEVVNQARVHHWFQSHFGQAVQPLRSLAEGIASWPEVATCVGVTLIKSGKIEVIAPHGLNDLFEMVVRWNPERVSKAIFLERVARKRFAERWPKVKVVPC